jgi:hypothetical protein
VVECETAGGEYMVECETAGGEYMVECETAGGEYIVDVKQCVASLQVLTAVLLWIHFFLHVK